MTEAIREKIDFRDVIFPSITIIFATAFVFGGFYFIKSLNNNLICQITDVAGEETNPTVGRLICCLIYFALSLGLVVIAEKKWKTEESHMLVIWTMAVLGGTLLWTSVGECSWHFGFKVMSDEGDQMFTSFPRIECIHGIPFFILSVLLFVTCYKKFSFPVASYIFAFLGNWYGHLCMIAAYPIARAMGSTMGVAAFYKLSAIVNAVIIAVIGVVLLKGKTEKTTKYLASVCFYVALGNVLFGVMMGET